MLSDFVEDYLEPIAGGVSLRFDDARRGTAASGREQPSPRRGCPGDGESLGPEIEVVG